MLMRTRCLSPTRYHSHQHYLCLCLLLMHQTLLRHVLLEALHVPPLVCEHDYVCVFGAEAFLPSRLFAYFYFFFSSAGAPLPSSFWPSHLEGPLALPLLRPVDQGYDRVLDADHDCDCGEGGGEQYYDAQHYGCGCGQDSWGLLFFRMETH